LCSELIDPEPAKRLSAAKAAVLVYLSSLDYLGEGPAPALQAAFAPFRAVEQGRYVLQTGTVGYTLAVAPTGRVLARLPWNEPGILVVEAPLRTKTSWYGRTGDVLPVVGLVGVLLMFLVQPKGSRAGIKK